MTLNLRSSLVLSLLILYPALCLPQQSGAGAESAPTANRYFLGPEDQLSIHVVDLDDVSDKPVRIDPEGYIELPLIGRVHAAGLSPEQLRTTLAQQLSTYIDKPQITINVLEYRSQPVSVIGEVNNPGLHQLQGPKRLVEVISLAGGLKPDAGQTVTITREIRWGVLPLPGAHVDASGQYSVADIQLDQLTSGQTPQANIEMDADDIVSISKAKVVYVVGEVKKAGGFTLDTHGSISLLRALSLAEGLTHDAAPKKARILRSPDPNGTQVAEIPINMQEVLAGRAPDLQLHANDVLFIPNNVAGSAMKRATEVALQIAAGVIIFH